MAIPIPRSYQSILGQQLNTVRSKLGISQYKPGGPLLTLMEASAMADAHNSSDIFTALESQDLDNAVGATLDRIGNSEKLPRQTPKSSTGYITISDSAFQKLSSTLYHGLPAPIVGSITIYITKGNTFDTAPSTGQVYLGRGTVNYEGPLAYSSKTDYVYYWALQISPTTIFHNQGESVILAQGELRPIQIGQAAYTAQGASTAPLTYTTTNSSNIPDGETLVNLVPIICSVDGKIGDQVANSVVSFGNSLPFPTAQVTNPNNISGGQDIETDQQYRDRIRQARSNKQRGTAYSIQNSVINLTSPDEPSTVLSSSLVTYKSRPAVLFIDDGSGYEEISSGVGLESIVDSANGGETNFQSIFSPISQAFLATANNAPYTIPNGATLTIRVGGVSSTHFFDSTQFTSPLNASAYDIAGSINNDAGLLFQARIVENGGGVAIFAKSETNDDLTVELSETPESDASVILGLSTSPTYTTSIYKNDVMLSKDGVLAQIVSNPIENWLQLSTPETIIINTDNTGLITYTITDTDFQSLGYSLLNNATTTIWAQVLNSRLPGITATTENDKIILTSNNGRSSLASINITGGSLVVKGMFGVDSVIGVSNDYSIDRAVGSIYLNSALSQYDKLSFGTNWSDAFVQLGFGSEPIAPSQNVYYYLNVDDENVSIIPTGVFKTGSYSSLFASPSPVANYFNLGVYPSTITTVNNLKQGDWVLLNDPVFAGTTWSGIFRTNNDSQVNIAQPADCATRIAHTSTSINNSNIVIMGGCTSVQNGIGLPGALKGRGVTGTCRVYNPSTGVWAVAADMITPRAYHTATLLGNGNIFITGGFDANGNILSSTEIFNTSALTFSVGPPMLTAPSGSALPRAHHTATLLGNGDVMVSGGCSTNVPGSTALTSSAQYSSGSNSWYNYSNMNTARYGHQAVLIGPNTVFIIGGITTIPLTAFAVSINTTEQYVSTFASWTTEPSMTSPRSFFGAAFNGTILVVAGCGVRTSSSNSWAPIGTSSSTYEVYTPGTNSWGSLGQLNAAYPSLTAIFSQSDLAVSSVSKNIIAGHVTFSTTGVPASVYTLIYNTSTNQWVQPFYVPLMNFALGNRESTTAASITSNDTVVWIGGAIELTVGTSFRGVSNVDAYDTVGLVSVNPYPLFTNLTPTEGRIIAVRSDEPPTAVEIPSTSNYSYTANTLSSVVSSPNITAEPYQTTNVRISTLSADGSLCVLDEDPVLPSLSPINLVKSQPSQFAHSTSRDLTGLPIGFQTKTAGSNAPDISPLIQTVDVPDYSEALATSRLPEPTPPNGIIIGLNDYSYSDGSGSNVVTNICGNSKDVKAIIGNVDQYATITEKDTQTYPSLGTRLHLRNSLPIISGNPVYFSGICKFNVNDTLSVTIDGNTDTQSFVIPMARKMATVGTYQTPLTLKDADNSNNTISTAFGTNYNFNDFALISRARVISDSIDSTKSVLWRYTRFGEEGNNVALRYVYPQSASQGVTVAVNPIQLQTNTEYDNGIPFATVDIGIGSGAARRNRNMSTNTHIGITNSSTDPTFTSPTTTYLFTGFTVQSGSRATLNGDTTLTIIVPYATGIITSPGLAIGDVLYYTGTSPSSTTFLNGQFTIKTISGSGSTWIITVNSLSLNDGTIWALQANPGVISKDPTQQSTFDTDVQIGDLVYLSQTSIPLFQNDTMRILAIDPNSQYIECTSISSRGIGGAWTSTIATYSQLNQLSNLQIFAPPSNTIATIVAAVNGAINTPLIGTITGSGTGVISKSSWDQYSLFYYRYVLTDGVNYIATTNYPANTSLQTTFNLKLSVNPNLVSNSDFTNEIFYLVPQLPQSIVSWLNTPTITGLGSVSTITTSQNGAKIQIKSQTPGSEGSVFVQGGTANLATAAITGASSLSSFNISLNSGMVATTTNGEASSLCGNSWVKLTNTSTMPKVNDATVTWGTANQILSVDTSGTFTFYSNPYNAEILTNEDNILSSIINIENVGDYTTVVLYKGFNSNGMSLALPGNWLSIQPFSNGISPANCGIFRILRVSQTESAWIYWINNINAINETGASANLINISYDSPVPGDVLAVNNTALGLGNQGNWTILNVGHGYTDNTITVSLPDQKTTALFTGYITTAVKNIEIIEGIPAIGIKKILCISPNKSNTSNSDILLDDGSLINFWQQSTGTVIEALDKLGFSNTIFNGTDAYRYNTGLIAEAKRVIYGDSADIDNYPGYAAVGASIVIQGPTIKQIKLAVQVRLQTNVTNTSITGNIISTVTGVINNSPVGVPIPISNIISAVNDLNGIAAVSIVYPAYSSAQDSIPLMGQEKAFVVDPENDIQVLFVSN